MVFKVNYIMQNILITGGAGNVARTLVEKLARDSNKLMLIFRLKKPKI